MNSLTSGQRKYLRGLAHGLEPIVIVGKAGVSAQLCDEVDHALNDHELIKVRFNEFKDKKDELSQELVQKTASALAGIIGHIAILYREHKEPRKRKIKLPL